jgi:hypothetical protein
MTITLTDCMFSDHENMEIVTICFNLIEEAPTPANWAEPCKIGLKVKPLKNYICESASGFDSLI